MIKKKELNQKDKKIWEDYIKNPADIYDKEKNTSKNILRRKRYKFDLHGFTLEEANQKVKEVINYCIKNKYKELLLITGKGNHSNNSQNTYISEDLGKLKYSVPDFIKTNEELNKLVAITDDISKIKISIIEALKNKDFNLKNRLSLAMENTYQKRTKKMLMELN